MEEKQQHHLFIPDYFSYQGRDLCYRIDALQNSLVQYEKKLGKSF